MWGGCEHQLICMAGTWTYGICIGESRFVSCVRSPIMEIRYLLKCGVYGNAVFMEMLCLWKAVFMEVRCFIKAPRVIAATHTHLEKIISGMHCFHTHTHTL